MPLSDLSNPDVLLRENWESHQRRSADGTPTLPPSFVAVAGPRVWLVDVREDDQLTGPAGHVPGVWRMGFRRLGDIMDLVPTDTPLILICDDGAQSATAARFLLSLGMPRVAAMRGGMHLWRQEGFAASRSPEILGHVLSRPNPGCGSDGRPLTSPKDERKLTAARIIDHVGDVAKVRRVKLAAFLIGGKTSCVDGREDRAIIGTPGGDAGELVLGMAASERVGGGQVDLAHVPAITRAFADTLGGIYLHTDNHALNRLTRSLRSDPRLEPAVGGLTTIEDWEGFLRNPPLALRSALLEHMMQPDHVGCGHLKLALTNPDTYGVRPELITAFFRAFFEGLWEGASDLEWVVLGGDHAEGAVLNITVEGELTPFSEVPMIAPSIGGVQTFVNHPQVAAYLREQTARFLTGSISNLLPTSSKDAKRLMEAIPKLGGEQTMATLKALAAGLQVFDVHFQIDGNFEVTPGDSIPARPDVVA